MSKIINLLNTLKLNKEGSVTISTGDSQMTIYEAFCKSKNHGSQSYTKSSDETSSRSTPGTTNKIYICLIILAILISSMSLAVSYRSFKELKIWSAQATLLNQNNTLQSQKIAELENSLPIIVHNTSTQLDQLNSRIHSLNNNMKLRNRLLSKHYFYLKHKLNEIKNRTQQSGGN